MNRAESPAPLNVKCVLVATDFSPGAESALRWASGLSTAFGAKLEIVHVLDLSLTGVAGLPSELPAVSAMGQLLDQLREETKAEMAKVAAHYPQAKTRIREGSPRTGVLDAARDVGADLIVVGTHGRSGLAHIFFGSVAEYVVRQSQIPVLTVRQHDR